MLGHWLALHGPWTPVKVNLATTQAQMWSEPQLHPKPAVTTWSGWEALRVLCLELRLFTLLATLSVTANLGLCHLSFS